MKLQFWRYDPGMEWFKYLLFSAMIIIQVASIVYFFVRVEGLENHISSDHVTVYGLSEQNNEQKGLIRQNYDFIIGKGKEVEFLREKLRKTEGRLLEVEKRLGLPSPSPGPD